ncbi:hypothetical protein [Prosthecobacter sp.]|uniref:hypothetical protein n=1 Tax=Prosthecobacter sp. TaxID=1965333 RepID=UPI00378351D3
MSRTPKLYWAALLALLLGSHAQPLKALTLIDSDLASWLEDGKDEVCKLAEPVPQLLLTLPKPDWFSLLTSTEHHLLSDPINPDARTVWLGDRPCFSSFYDRARHHTTPECLNSLILYDPLWRGNPPEFSSYLRNNEIEDKWRKFFWPKRLPAPTAVYPTPLISVSLGTGGSLTLKITNRFWQTEEVNPWPR